MKIYYKLLLPFLVFSLLIFLVGYLAVEMGKKALEEDIGKNTVYLADDVMEKLAGELDRSIENFEEYGRDLLLSEYLHKSNEEFERLGDARKYIESKEKSWRNLSEKEATPFLKSLTDNPLAREIMEKLKYYEEGAEKGYYEDVYVVNRFGAIVAQSRKADHYRHDNEPWWKRVQKNGGACVFEIEYDEKDGHFHLGEAIRVNDRGGAFIGAIVVSLDLDRMLAAFKKAIVSKGRPSFEYKLVSADGRGLFSDEEHKLREDLSGTKLFKSIKGDSGYFLVQGDDPGEGGELFAYSRLRGHNRLSRFGWTLLVEYPLDLVHAPAAGLKKILLWVLSAVTLAAVLASYLISKSISKGIDALGEAAKSIGEGDYDARISIASKDEVAGLARTFNAMAERLKEAVESRDLEIAERKRGEEKILQMAYYDTLTGLPNRTLFFDRLNQVTAWGKRHTRLAAVVFLDLDSFKTINDSFGHDV
ncbi:MAG TPA: diguanylate cyclase, partial [Thermodesulfobacteriota bacterium]|nr:diguanylate cyclase [Thermodesulfobacteriota bacterium]